MDQELRKEIEENRALIKENQKLIKKIHRSMVVGRVMSVLYWIVIIGASVGAYYFIQPYIDSALGAYTNVKTGFGAAQDVGDSVTDFGSIDSILNNLENLIE